MGSFYDSTLPAPTAEEFLETAWDQERCLECSFRNLLSKKYNLAHKNFAKGGSSNQRQFRFAKQYFTSDEFIKDKDTYEDIIVLWGITSTARNEFYSIDLKDYISFFYHQNKKWGDFEWPFPKYMLQCTYDHDVVVKELSLEMKFWDNFFENNGIKNKWFDSFNNHEYEYTDNLLFTEHKKHDLLSILAASNGLADPDNKYHISYWLNDTNKIDFLSKNGLVNPYSWHPTKQAHIQLCELFSPEVEKLIAN